MTSEAMIIQGKEQTVLVEDNQAYLLGKRGRRHLGTYTGISFSETNTPEETAILYVRAWVNPKHGPVRRALATMSINSPFFAFEAAYEPPQQTFKLSGPIHSRMIPTTSARAA